MIEALMNCGLIRQEKAGSGQFQVPVLVLTDLGREVMRGTRPLEKIPPFSPQILYRLGVISQDRSSPANPPRQEPQPVRPETLVSAPAIAPVQAAQTVQSVRTPLSAEEIDRKPGFFWTIQLLERNFSLDECAVIRNMRKSEILEDVLHAMEEGVIVRRQWIFTPERWQQLRKTLAEGMSQNGNFDDLNDQSNPPAVNMLEVMIFSRLNQF